MLCLELLRAPPPRRLRGIEPLDAVAASVASRRQQSLHTGIGEGSIHSIGRRPVDHGAGEQAGHRIYAVGASRVQKTTVLIHVREGAGGDGT